MEKTVFVLDWSPRFSCSSQQVTNFDGLSKGKQGGGDAAHPALQFSKSLWTCNVEACLEYHRIVRDLFPFTEPLAGQTPNKLVRFVISDSVGKFITPSWAEECQILEKLLESLARLGCPPSYSSDTATFSILNGLTLAIEALSQATKYQKYATEKAIAHPNIGRIVCLTSLKSDEEAKDIETNVRRILEGRNKVIANLKDETSFLRIDEIHLCLVNIQPVNETLVDLVEIHPCLSQAEDEAKVFTKAYSSHSGLALAGKMVHLVQLHYNLASTTVSGIPMKEEQNTGSSANYDVELIHHKNIHNDLIAAGYFENSRDLLLKRDSGYTTVMLKWCSPASKGTVQDQSYVCSCVSRVTPVEVNSRPSACLTNFILSGRIVQLEVVHGKTGSGSRLLSHTLMNHGGHIFIHSLNSTLWGCSPVDDPPAVSEGLGGRVTDYRIPDFGQFIKECRLTTGFANGAPGDLSGVLHCKQRLLNITRFWPFTYGSTVLFSMGTKLDPLLTLVKNIPTLTDNEVTECKKVIFGLLAMESSGNPLSTIIMCNKLKGLKREEQYKILWTELEQYVNQYAYISPAHRAILDCVLESQGKPRTDPGVSLQVTMRPIEMEMAWEELEKVNYNKEGKRSKPGSDHSPSTPSGPGPGIGSLITDDGRYVLAERPDSPPLVSTGYAKKARLDSTDSDSKPAGRRNLLAMWTQKYITDRWSKWRDFDGRIGSSGSSVVELYPELMAKFRESAAAATEIQSPD